MPQKGGRGHISEGGLLEKGDYLRNWLSEGAGLLERWGWG